MIASVEMNDRAGPLTVEHCDSCFAALKERDRGCLRLVARNYKTKEIARQLGLSTHTVNKIIFDIRSSLDGEYRGSVARLFIEWEARQADFSKDQRLPPSAPTPGGVVPPDRNSEDRSDEPPPAGPRLTEPQRAYVVSRISTHIPLRVGGKQANHLPARETLVTIAILATAALVALGSAVSLLTGLSGLIH
ncbi:LuxR C-terminal-related transcriptional regulator [Sphingomonas sp. QA11]|uniref:LuxR C-terminal-related transcriptional regulator n=1 Tax=Sphingomonas sp. QA11 TaxID=2950605 RepID=UPI00234B0F2F|nr:LuxR C-terminal-related transcriptional regulator [Sphingomonas sp. QA11]WCM29919.1 LuxR C-terminal-related transcriptional regulator [Sphingomonas sp. QA11]